MAGKDVGQDRGRAVISELAHLCRRIQIHGAIAGAASVFNPGSGGRAAAGAASASVYRACDQVGHSGFYLKIIRRPATLASPVCAQFGALSPEARGPYG